jgi:hypothetical protein
VKIQKGKRERITEVQGRRYGGRGKQTQRCAGKEEKRYSGGCKKTQNRMEREIPVQR